MKKRATKVALTVAMPSATAALKGPRSRVAANTVRAVPTSSAKNTAKYIFNGEDDECADMEASRVPVDQVEQRKQVNPDNVDKVPVQPADFHRRVVFGSEAPFPGHNEQPEKNAEADDHVQRGQALHDEIEREKYLRVLRISILAGMPGDRFVFETERCSRDMMFDKLFAVFDALDAEKTDAEKHRDDKAADQQCAARSLRGPDCENHGEAAADQHSSIGGSVGHVDGLAGSGEVAEIPAAIN